MFRPGEIDVAAELVEARLQRGGASGYEFVFAERDGVVLAYVCFGRNTLTVSSFDLYWIAVEESLRGQGLGGILLRETERLSALAGATRLYIETSHRPDYADTRRFYERNGYQLAALLPDFYAPGDDRAIFVRSLGD
jgi:GNAT superfamily N-acetyltransferase